MLRMHLPSYYWMHWTHWMFAWSNCRCQTGPASACSASLYRPVHPAMEGHERRQQSYSHPAVLLASRAATQKGQAVAAVAQEDLVRRRLSHHHLLVHFVVVMPVEDHFLAGAAAESCC